MSKIPVHQWTHDGKEVLLVKCVGADGKSYGGFQWPQSGQVETAASRKPDCLSGGLFGWPWGLNIGGGKDPDYNGRWIVFSASPENVIEIEGNKAKVAPKEGETIARANVLFCGNWFEALRYCALGREAWQVQAIKYCDKEKINLAAQKACNDAKGSAAATGSQSSAADTGWQSSAAATGWRSSAAATGGQSSAAATGSQSSAAATGEQSSAAATGERSSAAATGGQSSAAATLCAFAGLEGRVRGKIGGALILAFEKKDKSVVAKATIIDGKKIKAGVWYSLNKQGSFVASKDQSKIFGEKDEEQKP